MPLSDSESRAFDDIVRSLTGDAAGSHPREPRQSRRPVLVIVAALAMLCAGLGLLVAAISLGPWLGPISGVLGFLVMVDGSAQLATVVYDRVRPSGGRERA